MLTLLLLVLLLLLLMLLSLVRPSAQPLKSLSVPHHLLHVHC